MDPKEGICFIEQTASAEILLRVTNVCGECYDDLHEGDTIYYDTTEYRYLCECCKEKLCARMNEACEVVREEDGGLFC